MLALGHKSQRLRQLSDRLDSVLSKKSTFLGLAHPDKKHISTTEEKLKTLVLQLKAQVDDQINYWSDWRSKILRGCAAGVNGPARKIGSLQEIYSRNC